MTQNYIWWRGSRSWNLDSEEYLLITITPSSTLTQSGNAY